MLHDCHYFSYLGSRCCDAQTKRFEHFTVRPKKKPWSSPRLKYNVHATFCLYDFLWIQVALFLVYLRFLVSLISLKVI